MECQIARFTGNGDAAVKLHVTLQRRVHLVILAALLANERPIFGVYSLNVARQRAEH